LRVIITAHAKKRLSDLRQKGISTPEIVEAALKIPGYVPAATRFRRFTTRTGKEFDLVVKDVASGRLIITIIGK